MASTFMSAAPDTAEPPGAQGVFETVLLLAGEPVFVDDHLQRFIGGCTALALRAAPDVARLRAAIAALPAGGPSRGVLRWSAWRTAAGTAGWNLRQEPPRPAMLKALWRALPVPATLPPPGPMDRWKHLSRNAWREALASARAQGWDEALVFDTEGRVVEGAISNFFGVLGSRLVTPPLARGVLPGIVRKKVLVLAREMGLTVVEGDMTAAELASVSEAFVTNSLVGLRPLAALGARNLPAPGPLTTQLREAWLGRYGWC